MSIFFKNHFGTSNFKNLRFCKYASRSEYGFDTSRKIILATWRGWLHRLLSLHEELLKLYVSASDMEVAIWKGGLLTLPIYRPCMSKELYQRRVSKGGIFPGKVLENDLTIRGIVQLGDGKTAGVKKGIPGLQFPIIHSNTPANIYLFKVNNRNTEKRCEICLNLKTPERRYWCFIVSFEHISHLFPVFRQANVSWD